MSICSSWLYRSSGHDGLHELLVHVLHAYILIWVVYLGKILVHGLRLLWYQPSEPILRNESIRMAFLSRCGCWWFVLEEAWTLITERQAQLWVCLFHLWGWRRFNRPWSCCASRPHTQATHRQVLPIVKRRGTELFCVHAMPRNLLSTFLFCFTLVSSWARARISTTRVSFLNV